MAPTSESPSLWVNHAHYVRDPKAAKVIRAMCAKKQEKDVKKKPSRSRKKVLRPSISHVNADDRRKWEIELEFFQKMKPTFLKDERYRDKYIAIKDEEIIDCDIDEFKLVRRINKTFPDQVILIVEVNEDEWVAELRSPRVAP